MFVCGVCGLDEVARVHRCRIDCCYNAQPAIAARIVSARALSIRKRVRSRAARELRTQRLSPANGFLSRSRCAENTIKQSHVCFFLHGGGQDERWPLFWRRRRCVAQHARHAPLQTHRHTSNFEVQSPPLAANTIKTRQGDTEDTNGATLAFTFY